MLVSCILEKFDTHSEDIRLSGQPNMHGHYCPPPPPWLEETSAGSLACQSQKHSCSAESCLQWVEFDVCSPLISTHVHSDTHISVITSKKKKLLTCSRIYGTPLHSELCSCRGKLRHRLSANSSRKSKDKCQERETSAQSSWIRS